MKTHLPIVKSLLPKDIIYKVDVPSEKQQDKHQHLFLSSVLLSEEKGEGKNVRERKRKRRWGGGKFNNKCLFKVVK